MTAGAGDWRAQLYDYLNLKPGTRPNSVVTSDQQAIAHALLIHTPVAGYPQVLDVTWNRGRSWRKLPVQPVAKSDLFPTAPDVARVPWVNLVEYWSPRKFDLLFIDTPHQSDGGHNQDAQWADNFGSKLIRGHDNIAHIYELLLQQSAQLLTPRGIVLFKIADMVHAQKAQWQHVMLCNESERLGWTVCDMSIKIRPAHRPDPKHKRVLHVGKNHSFFLTLRHDGKC